MSFTKGIIMTLYSMITKQYFDIAATLLKIYQVKVDWSKRVRYSFSIVI